MNNQVKIQSDLLRLVRKKKGLNQFDISKMIGTTRTNYASIEMGNSHPSLRILIGIIKATGISFDELYGLKPSRRLLSLKKAKIKELKDELKKLETP